MKPRIVDSSLWIDLVRAKSSRELEVLIASHLRGPNVCLVKPVRFETLRSADRAEARLLEAYFSSLRLLDTPGAIWETCIELGRACRRQGLSAGSMDLIIAGIALHHQAEIVTFDRDFERIGSMLDIEVTLLHRPEAP